MDKFVPLSFKKIKFRLENDEPRTIYKLNSFLAQHHLGRIFVDNLFDKFTRKEQKVILWHEEYHRQHMSRRLILLIKSPFTKYNASQLEELEADEYSAKKAGKSCVLSVLKKIKKLEKQGLLKHSIKTHPTTEDRISQIEKLG